MTSGELIHYLDDFLRGDKCEWSCSNIMSIFSTVMSEINVPIADEKTEGPSEVLVFLGLELDSVNMTVRIPIDKMHDVLGKISLMLSKHKTTLKDMQSLIGLLNFCCRAIPMGRPFCRRLINAICGVTKPYHHIRINAGIRKDLQMWKYFFLEHNGLSVFHDRFWVSNEDLNLYTDSAGGLDAGFGVYFGGQWCNAKWPEMWHTVGITVACFLNGIIMMMFKVQSIPGMDKNFVLKSAQNGIKWISREGLTVYVGHLMLYRLIATMQYTWKTKYL